MGYFFFSMSDSDILETHNGFFAFSSEVKYFLEVIKSRRMREVSQPDRVTEEVLPCLLSCFFL